MNGKINLPILAVALATTASLPLGLQYRQASQQAALHEQLSLKNITLQATVHQLRTEWQEAQQKRAQAIQLASSPIDDAKYIPVSIDYIKHLGFATVQHGNGEADAPWIMRLAPEAIGLLGLTSEETAQVQQIFIQVQQRLQQHMRATARPLPADDLVESPKIRRASGRHP